MLVQKKLSGLKKFLVNLLVVFIVALVSYVVYDTFLADRYVSQQTDFTGKIDVFEPPTTDTSLNIDFINRAPYTDLEQNGVLPITVGQKGRDNPFRRILFSF